MRGFLGPQQLENALVGMDLVIIPAGVPRKPGMTRDDLFKINAGIVKTLCEGITKFCPNAIVNLISNPVNSTVPIAAEVFKRAGTFDPKRLLGVTMLDVVRANTFVVCTINLSFFLVFLYFWKLGVLLVIIQFDISKDIYTSLWLITLIVIPTVLLFFIFIDHSYIISKAPVSIGFKPFVSTPRGGSHFLYFLPVLREKSECVCERERDVIMPLHGNVFIDNKCNLMGL